MQETDSQDSETTKRDAGAWLRRAWPLFVIALIALAVFASGAHRYLTFEAMREHHAQLETFVSGHYYAALALYTLVYIVITAISLPGATMMSVLGGILFGVAMGTGAVVISATFGATLIFLAARSALRDFFAARASGFIRKMEAGFSENAFSYLLLLRLIPLFPFFIVNIVPAFTQIRIRTFIAATLIGVVPGAFAFVSAGNGLGAILERGDEIELSGMLAQPEILMPIIALSLLALLPVLYRMLRIRKTAAPNS